MIPMQTESLAQESAYRRSQVARSRGRWSRLRRRSGRRRSGEPAPATRPSLNIPSSTVRTALYVVPSYSWILR
ncbi:hypothetical protein CLV47_1373 [Antricoccus suffuscus]|uniref:Uncharacterized protein n=1 Tax=Antricoccus suffuscus TaxID=1629062 RepID=A0A2T0YY09_9ACTN|nr:hypothetical protein CLV47_1373 [Antricoccus suffuscus]